MKTKLTLFTLALLTSNVLMAAEAPALEAPKAAEAMAQSIPAIVDIYNDFNRMRNATEDEICAAIEAGADVHKTTEFRSNALYLAAVHNHYRAIKLLLEKGVDARIQSDRDQTPFYEFLFECGFDNEADLQLVSLFLNRFPDVVNIPSNWPDYPLPLDLMIAKVKDKNISPAAIEYKVIEELLGYGAKCTPAIAAEFVKNADRYNHDTAIIPLIATALLTHNTPMRAEAGKTPATPILDTYKLYQEECGKKAADRIITENILCKVINSSTDVNERDKCRIPQFGRMNPLGFAAYYGHTNVVSALLSKGANPFDVDTFGETVIHAALRCPIYTDNTLKIITQLVASIHSLPVEQSFLYDYKTSLINTLYTHLLQRRCVLSSFDNDVIEKIFPSTAKIKENNKKLLSIREMQSEYNDKRIAAEAAKPSTTPIHDIYKKYLQEGQKAFKRTITENDICTAIHASADVDERDKDKSTPLYYAANKGHINATKALLLKGANPACTNRVEETPVNAALYCLVYTDNTLEILDALFTSINAHHGGGTFLHYNKTSLVNTLCKHFAKNRRLSAIDNTVIEKVFPSTGGTDWTNGRHKFIRDMQRDYNHKLDLNKIASTALIASGSVSSTDEEIKNARDHFRYHIYRSPKGHPQPRTFTPYSLQQLAARSLKSYENEECLRGLERSLNLEVSKRELKAAGISLPNSEDEVSSSDDEGGASAD